jgi:hypothetical protein
LLLLLGQLRLLLLVALLLLSLLLLCATSLWECGQ